MANITIKGHEFNAVTAKDAFDRRAVQYKNNIISTLTKIGVSADDVIIDLEIPSFKNKQAIVTWYTEGYRLYYSYKLATKYVDNLYIAFKVIEFEVNDLINGVITFDEFLLEFVEKDDVEQMRKEAREILGVTEDCMDLALINKKYKDLAKSHHPDMSGGDVEMFKKINNAHKILKRELS